MPWGGEWGVGSGFNAVVRCGENSSIVEKCCEVEGTSVPSKFSKTFALSFSSFGSELCVTIHKSRSQAADMRFFF